MILTLVCAGTFMSTLDASIVNVALPTLSKRFGVHVQTSQWFVLIYSLVTAILLLTAGKLGDIRGRKRIYTAGVAVFSAGSLACGVSFSALTLILSRAFQAVGASAIMANGPALVTEVFHRRERGKSLGLIGTAVALGLLAGPVVGGVILQHANYPSPAHAWRWIFLINVPIGVALTALMKCTTQPCEPGTPDSLDIRGSVFLGACLCSLVVGLHYAGTAGWRSPVILVALLASLALGVLFIRTERSIPNPVLDVGLFLNREFTIGTLAGWANYAASMPVAVFLPFYLHGDLGMGPQTIGIVVASGPLTMAVVAPLAGTLSDRIGPRVLTVAGLIVAGTGILMVRALGPDATWIDVVWRLALTSFGSAMFVSPNSSSVMGSVPSRSLGTAGGVVALVRNLGMVLGVALAAAIITSFSGKYSLEGLKAALLACAMIAFAGSMISAVRTDSKHKRATP